MENKLLGAALQFAKQVQEERDRKKLQSQAFTKATSACFAPGKRKR